MSAVALLTEPCGPNDVDVKEFGCAAINGVNRMMAILGTSEHCIASNPSDMNVALTALEATIHIQNSQGVRSVAINDFYLLPGDTPQRETVMESGDLITHVTRRADRVTS
jgi:xanthine dehydrogenase YagS FAD-binding subunit